MAGGITVRVTATAPDLGPALRKAIAPAVRRRAERMGQAMVDSVQASVGKYKVRPAKERRYPGSTRITSGWSYKVVGDPSSLPIFVNLLSRGDGNYQKRIEYLDKGTSSHTIRAHGGYLRIPSGGRYFYAKEATVSGVTAANFIQTALDAGMAAGRGG